MKSAQSRNIAMSDMFRAIAGAPEAQYELVACTVYSAAYSIMEAGNKTQFAKLEADASMYGTSSDARKNAKDALGAKSVNAAVKHYNRTYFAIAEALRQCGIPADMQKELPAGKAQAAARAVILDPLAQDYADQFTAVFTSVMMMPEKTDDERTAAADKRAEAKRQKELDAASHAREAERVARMAVDAEVAARVERVTSDDVVVSSVIDMLSAGMLPAALEQALIEAVRMRETALLLARAASTEPEAIPA